MNTEVGIFGSTSLGTSQSPEKAGWRFLSRYEALRNEICLSSQSEVAKPLAG